MANFRIGRKRFVSRLLVSYLLILIIPMVILAAVFFEMTKIVKYNALESNLNSTRQTQYVIDQSLNELDKLIIDISSDPSFQWLINKKTALSANEYYDLYDINKRLREMYNVSSHFVLNFFIVYPQSGIVMSQMGTYELANFYGYIYNVEGMDYDTWLSTYINTYNSKKFIPSALISMEGRTEKAITLLNSIPVQKVGTYPATVLILISESKLLSSLDIINTDTGGNIIISDSNGQIIASKNPVNGIDTLNDPDTEFMKFNGCMEVSLGGESMLLSGVQSGTTGFRCVALSRSDIALSEVNALVRIVICIYIIALVLGGVIASLLSYVNAKPFKDILNMAQKRFGGSHSVVTDEYSYLKSTFSTLIETDSALKDKMEKYLPIAQADFIGKLLRGEITDADAMIQNISQLGLDLSGRWYNVVIVTINGYSQKTTTDTLKELNAIKLLIKTNWDELSQGRIKWITCDKDERSILVLTISSDGSMENCQNTLNNELVKIETEFLKKYGLTITIEGSQFCDDIMDIYYVYSYLKDTQNRKEVTEPVLNSIPEVFDSNRWIYYYPLDFEQRLVNVVKTGNKTEMYKLIDILYNENFIENKMSSDMLNNFFNEIRGTVFKVFNILNINGQEQIYNINTMLKKIKTGTESHERFEETRNVFSYICDAVSYRREDAKSALADDIREFLTDNYSNSSMSLSLVASNFGYSDTNFSYFLKEYFGQNFSDYLENIRISAACSLIGADAYSFEEIAEKVGYNSSTSFRRAFKRVKGIIPSQYKKLETEKI